MSADYWNSTQRRHWQFSRDALSDKRRELQALEQELLATHTLPPHVSDIHHDDSIRIFLHNLVHRLGRRLGLRSIPIGTAEVYMHRFLLNVLIKEINLYLLAATCLYLACKVEECPQHIRTISNEARNLWPEYIPHDLTKIAEFEFYLIEEMDNYLIIHNPYRSLAQIRTVLSRTNFGILENGGIQNLENMGSNSNGPSYNTNYNSSANYNNNSNRGSSNANEKLVDGTNCLLLTSDELQLSWSIINDSFVTDVCLLYPPHIIAITAIYLCLIFKSSRIIAATYSDLPYSLQSASHPPHGPAAGSSATAFLLKRASHLTGGAGQNRNNSSASSPLTASMTPEQKAFHDSMERRLNIFTNFLGISNIDLNEVIEVVQEMITLYEVWDGYDDRATAKKVQRLFINR